jgi:hypothetical protein
MVKFSVCPSTLLNNKECSPLWVNEGVNFTPRGQISPLGAKFTPRGEIHPLGPGVKLRIALRRRLSKKDSWTGLMTVFPLNFARAYLWQRTTTCKKGKCRNYKFGQMRIRPNVTTERGQCYDLRRIVPRFFVVLQIINRQNVKAISYVPYSTALCYIAWSYFEERYVVLSCITSHYIMLYFITYNTLYCITLHYVTVCYGTLHCMMLHYITSRHVMFPYVRWNSTMAVFQIWNFRTQGSKLAKSNLDIFRYFRQLL